MKLATHSSSSGDELTVLSENFADAAITDAELEAELDAVRDTRLPYVMPFTRKSGSVRCMLRVTGQLTGPGKPASDSGIGQRRVHQLVYSIHDNP